MQPLEFLATVLPTSGYYCLAELRHSPKRHIFKATIAELADGIKMFAKEEGDIFFSLSSFVTVGKRTAANANKIRAFFFDIDCGGDHKYKTKKEAVEALSKFLKETKLDVFGKPWIVSSGGGIHVYFPFTYDVFVHEWKPTAEALKLLCAEHDFDIDQNVTADAARVLRVPDTVNSGYKNGKRVREARPVQLKIEGSIFDFKSLSKAIRDQVKDKSYTELASPTPAVIPGTRPQRLTDMPATKVKLIENSENFFAKLMDKTVNGKGCAQLKYYLDNAQESNMEPLWRGLLSITNRCTDGEEFAIQLSKMHPYPEQRMYAKLRDLKSSGDPFYLCSKFNSENPRVCPTCPNYTKIKSPLSLCARVVAGESEKEVVVKAEILNDDGAPIAPIVTVRSPAPNGFMYGKTGGLYRVVKETDPDTGKTDNIEVLVLPYDLFLVEILKNIDQEHMAYMVAARKEGAKAITIPQSAIISKDETLKFLAKQNILANTPENDKYLHQYIRRCVEEASASRRVVDIPASYGWQADSSFVYRDTIYRANGRETFPMPDLANINKYCTYKGTVENWKRVIRMLINKKLYTHLALGMTGFGSPIMQFGNVFGLIFHICSRKSGTGKSLSLRIAASVWGNPDIYGTSPDTSSVTSLHHVGVLNSLPFVMDETTVKTRQDVEWFPSLALTYTGGKGKDRMFASVNKERINNTQWKSMMLMSANTNMVDSITGLRQYSTDSELLRFLQYTPTDKLEWTPEEEADLNLLKENYGVIGDLWVDYLVKNVDECKRIYKETHIHLKEEMDFTYDERFWWEGITACITACILLGERYANIIDLPIRNIMQSFHQIVMDMRAVIKDSERSGEDVLNAFIREYYSKCVVLRPMSKSDAGDANQEAMLVDGIMETISRGEICGRVEYDNPKGFATLYIEQRAIRGFCAGMGFDYADFVKALKELPHTQVKEHRLNLLAGIKAPPMRVDALRIVRSTEKLNEVLGD
jgi:hypothetical protein